MESLHSEKEVVGIVEGSIEDLNFNSLKHKHDIRRKIYENSGEDPMIRLGTFLANNDFTHIYSKEGFLLRCMGEKGVSVLYEY